MRNLRNEVRRVIREELEAQINVQMNEGFIPDVGEIDTWILKDMLIKNPKVNRILDAESMNFIKKPEVVVIKHQSKRFNSIFTDGVRELEIDLKLNRVVKPLGKARKKIVDFFKSDDLWVDHYRQKYY